MPGLDKREKTDEVLACDHEDPVLENPAAALPTAPAIAIPKAHKVEPNDKAQKQDDKGPETNDDKGELVEISFIKKISLLIRRVVCTFGIVFQHYQIICLSVMNLLRYPLLKNQLL